MFFSVFVGLYGINIHCHVRAPRLQKMITISSYECSLYTQYIRIRIHNVYILYYIYIYLFYSTHACQKQKFGVKWFMHNICCGTQTKTSYRDRECFTQTNFRKIYLRINCVFVYPEITGILLRLRGRISEMASYIWNGNTVIWGYIFGIYVTGTGAVSKRMMMQMMTKQMNKSTVMNNYYHVWFWMWEKSWKFDQYR